MLLFDLTATQPIGKTKRHGGGIYAEKVFFSLLKKNAKFACFYDSQLWINPDILKDCKKYNIKLHDIAKEHLETFEEKYSTLYSALPNRATTHAKIKKIFTIHGLRTLEAPYDKFRYLYGKNIKYKLKETVRILFQQLLKKKERKNFINDYLWDPNNIEIITVSNHSKASFEILIPELKQQKVLIKTFYAPSTIETPVTINRNNNVPKYLFMVSGNRWEKNCLRACIAFDELISSGYYKNIKIKIAGASIDSFNHKFKNPESIELLGYVSDEELKSLYRDAYIFVYPSLNEGFGYPPLEAMANSVPVISSCFASIPEICGDAVMYFNPLSIQEIKNRMIQMDNPSVIQEFIEKGKRRFEHIKRRQERDLELMTDYLLSKSN